MADWLNFLSEWEKAQVDYHNAQIAFHREEVSRYANRGNVRMHREKKTHEGIRNINERLAAE